MKKFLFLFLLSGSICFAAVTNQSVSSTPLHPEANQYANINKGNWEVDGSINFAQSTSEGLTTTVSPSVKYFFANRFAVGGTLDLEASNKSTFVGIGPDITYYFISNNKWGGYLSLGASFISDTYKINSYSAPEDAYVASTVTENSISLRSSLGFNYFITPSVAIGPSLIYSRNLSEGYITSSGRIRILGSFSIYL